MDPFLPLDIYFLKSVYCFLMSTLFYSHLPECALSKQFGLAHAPCTNNIKQTTLPHPIPRKIVLNCIVCPLYIHKVAIDVHTSNSNFKIHRGSWDIWWPDMSLKDLSQPFTTLLDLSWAALTLLDLSWPLTTLRDLS